MPPKMSAPLVQHSYLLPVEKDFDIKSATQFIEDTWHWPLLLSFVVYLPSLYVGQKLMANREPFKLRGPLIVWNLALALFSLVGFLRVWPEFHYAFIKRGFMYSICNNSYRADLPAGYWTYVFALSKIAELGDTWFLVLKKQKLMFLHVYHHASVLLYAWWIWGQGMSTVRWYATMNLFIHTLMYAYYALKALPSLITIPKWFSMFLTSLQILQMVMGAIIVVTSTWAKLSGGRCDVSYSMSIFGIIVYVSYCALFVNFFVQAYLVKRPVKQVDAKTADTKKKA